MFTFFFTIRTLNVWFVPRKHSYHTCEYNPHLSRIQVDVICTKPLSTVGIFLNLFTCFQNYCKEPEIICKFWQSRSLRLLFILGLAFVEVSNHIICLRSFQRPVLSLRALSDLSRQCHDAVSVASLKAWNPVHVRAEKSIGERQKPVRKDLMSFRLMVQENWKSFKLRGLYAVIWKLAI